MNSGILGSMGGYAITSAVEGLGLGSRVLNWGV